MEVMEALISTRPLMVNTEKVHCRVTDTLTRGKGLMKLINNIIQGLRFYWTIMFSCATTLYKNML